MFQDISELPLGKLLQPKQERGVSSQVPKGKVRKLRKKGMPKPAC